MASVLGVLDVTELARRGDCLLAANGVRNIKKMKSKLRLNFCLDRLCSPASNGCQTVVQQQLGLAVVMRMITGKAESIPATY